MSPCWPRWASETTGNKPTRAKRGTSLPLSKFESASRYVLIAGCLAKSPRAGASPLPEGAIKAAVLGKAQLFRHFPNAQRTIVKQGHRQILTHTVDEAAVAMAF